MQPDVVLDIQIGAPVANLCSAFQSGELNDRIPIFVMHGDTFLLTLHKFFVRRRRDVIVWTIGQRGSRFCNGRVSCERFETLGRRVRMNLGEL